MVAQVLWSDLVLVSVKIAGHGPERLRVLLPDALCGNRGLFRPRMALQRECFPDQPHLSFVGRVNQRLNFVEGLGAIGAFEIRELYYRYRSIGGTQGRAVRQTQQFRVNSLPGVGDSKRCKALRENSFVL